MTATRMDPMRDDVLARLGKVSAVRGIQATARLGELLGCIDDDMRAIEATLDELAATRPRAVGDTPVYGAVRHLLAQRGKRLRPMCVALAARIGNGFSDEARELAVSAELVHAATLLHDDVVDLGDLRRGVETARAVYGNAASIFGGDWLLVEALRRIHASRVPGVVEQVLAVLAQMLAAESLQLANRGIVNDDLDGFETYGERLGVAFQIVDDLLDVTGNAEITGKSLFADLREGKMTYPLILAMRKDDTIAPLVREAANAEGARREIEIHAYVGEAIRATGAAEDAKRFARDLSAEAVAALGPLSPSMAKDALECIAIELADRSR
jgi:octaprenyl-diphosphate synthase